MATLIKIGNSQGVRIPKAIIEQASLENKELEFKVVEEGLLIQAIREPRKGWKEKFDQAHTIEDADAVDEEWLNAPLVEDED